MSLLRVEEQANIAGLLSHKKETSEREGLRDRSQLRDEMKKKYLSLSLSLSVNESPRRYSPIFNSNGRIVFLR